MSEGTNVERREERFTVTRPPEVDVHLVSGDTAIRTGDAGEVKVTVLAKGAAAAERLARTEVAFDDATGRLTVRSPLRGPGGKKAKKWMEFMPSGDDEGINLRKLLDFSFRDDVDVELTVPAGTHLDLHTASGDLAASGEYGVVAMASASGDAMVDHATELRVQSASGDVTARAVSGTVNVKSSSGDIELGRLGGDIKVVSVSGDVAITLDRAADCNVHSVSGEIVVSVREGLVVEVDAKSLSGDLKSAIDLSDGGATAGPGEETVRITAGTVSGDIFIRRASASTSDAPSGRMAKWLARAAQIVSEA